MVSDGSDHDELAEMRHEQVPAALAGERLDRLVALLADVPRTLAESWIDEHRVTVRGAPARSKSQRVTEGAEIGFPVVRASEDPRLEPDPHVEVEVVYVDDDVIVVDKPAGLVVHPGKGHERGTLIQGLLARYPDLADLSMRKPGGAPYASDDAVRPGIVQRLDRGTSGLMVIGRSAEAVSHLVGQLSGRTVERSYDALAKGHFESASGLIDAPIGRSDADPTKMTVSATGRQARTRYQVVQSFDYPEPVTRLRCRLETGRTHQIRVHLRAIGHPVVGDGRYGSGAGALTVPRPFLHAAVLGFIHPSTGEPMRFESPLPDDLQAVLALLR